MNRFLMTVLPVLIFTGCVEFDERIRLLGEPDFTTQFDLLKGKMKPVEGYEKTFLSQEQERPFFFTGCISLDDQIFVCEGGCRVTSVSNGIVKKVKSIAGWGACVIVQSGKYISVYSRLDQVTVKEGDSVFANAYIGRTSAAGSVHFQIYKKTTKLDPSEWIDIDKK